MVHLSADLQGFPEAGRAHGQDHELLSVHVKPEGVRNSISILFIDIIIYLLMYIVLCLVLMYSYFLCIIYDSFLLYTLYINLQV